MGGEAIYDTNGPVTMGNSVAHEEICLPRGIEVLDRAELDLREEIPLSNEESGRLMK